MPVATLVSVGIGEKYEAPLYSLRASAKQVGFAYTRLWTQKHVEDDMLTYGDFEAFNGLWMAGRKAALDRQRPYCAAFKAMALWKAMVHAREGEYVAWADASKMHSAVLRHSVRDAIAVLLGRSKVPRTRKKLN